MAGSIDASRSLSEEINFAILKRYHAIGMDMVGMVIEKKSSDDWGI